MNLEIEKIDHIHVNVKERATSEVWYKKVFNFYRTPELEFWSADGGPLTLQNPTGSVHIALFENGDSQNTTIAFKVSAQGLLDYINNLATLDISVVPVDHQASWSIYFQDPDSNPFEITTYQYKEFTKFRSAA